MRRRYAALLVVIVIAVGVLTVTAGRLPYLWSLWETRAQPATSAPAGPGGPAAVSIVNLEATLEGVYHQVSPSVVAIHVVQTVQVPAMPEIPGFPFFGVPGPGAPRRQYRQRLGSGFVWDTAGHVVTNNHVVDGADSISVTFSDGSSAPGKVVGRDPSSDLAVIKVDVAPDRLPPVVVADSTRVTVGQLAIAIGNPFGEQNTMTTGIVSAVGRSLPSSDGAPGGPAYTIPDVIQTDAPINPGNSGGVLLDAQGRLIGVTSAIESPVAASAGIGFAIPAAIVQRVVPALISTGRYEHPWHRGPGWARGSWLRRPGSVPGAQHRGGPDRSAVVASGRQGADRDREAGCAAITTLAIGSRVPCLRPA
jgi:serine protease Do